MFPIHSVLSTSLTESVTELRETQFDAHILYTGVKGRSILLPIHKDLVSRYSNILVWLRTNPTHMYQQMSYNNYTIPFKININMPDLEILMTKRFAAQPWNACDRNDVPGTFATTNRCNDWETWDSRPTCPPRARSLPWLYQRSDPRLRFVNCATCLDCSRDSTIWISRKG